MSKIPSKFEEWVVNIGDKHNEPFSDIIPTTESLRASTDNEDQKPSIFIDLLPYLVYFQCPYYDGSFWGRKKCGGWQFVSFMRRWLGLNVGSYLQYMQEKEHLARGYYQGRGFYGNSDIEKELFREYLLMNSCILVFAILLFQNIRNGIEILSGTKEKIRRDPKDQRSIEFYILYQYIMEDPMKIKLQMLSMRYQMPWFVVESIYTNHSNLSEFVDTPIDKLALSCFDDLNPRVHKSKVHGGIGTLPPGGFKHLLHMFHWSRTPEGMFLVEKRSLQSIKMIGYFYIPSATNLQLSETVFKNHASGSIYMSYHDRRLLSGKIHLTPWHLLQYSTELYKELLTFEGFYVDCGLPFMSYVACMACLLNTEEDVRVLRASGIIQSMMFNNNDVLRCVKDLKSMIDNNVYMPNELVILEEKVMKHNQRSSYRVYGEFKSRYCSNPWIIVSVIAGIVLFVLTFIQTLYGTLSYYKQ